MARPLAIDSLSLTGGGVALVTDAAGSIEPRAVAGLFVEDVRILSRWHLDTGAPFQLVGRSRTGPSSDRLLSTISSPGTIDPIATLERARTVDATGLIETIRIVAYSARVQCVIRLAAARDDQAVFVVGDGGEAAQTVSTIAGGPAAGRFIVPGPERRGGRHDPGRRLAPRRRASADGRRRRPRRIVGDRGGRQRRARRSNDPPGADDDGRRRIAGRPRRHRGCRTGRPARPHDGRRRAARARRRQPVLPRPVRSRLADRRDPGARRARPTG